MEAKLYKMQRKWVVVVGLWLIGMSASVIAQDDPNEAVERDFAENIVMFSTSNEAYSAILPNTTIRLSYVEVHIDINDTVATTRMEIRLSNIGDTPQEAELLLPVPHGAVINGFEYEGPEGTMTGQLLSRDQAERIYNRLVGRVRDPGLLEFVGYSLIRSSVFPIEAKSWTRIEMSYSHLLELEGNRVDYVLLRTESLSYPIPWRIKATVRSSEPISTVYSPTHKVYANRESSHEIGIVMDIEGWRTPGPFRLSYLVEADTISGTVFAYPDDGVQGGYFLLVAGAPGNLPADSKFIPREMTLVLDRSGSMSGHKIVQAKEAALRTISDLRQGEAFNMIKYNGTIEPFAPFPVIKNEQTAEDVNDFIDDITATGSTNIYDALQTALRPLPQPDMLPLVLFLTDGLPTSGQTSEVAIRDLMVWANPYARRVYTVGIGYDLNAPLLAALADLSGGKSFFLRPHENISEAIDKLAKSLSSPLLMDTTIKLLKEDGRSALGRTWDLVPEALPDVYADEQLVILGRYSGSDPLLVEITGNYLNERQRFQFSFDPNTASLKNGFVPRLWASRKIAYLIDLVRQMQAEPDFSVHDPVFKTISEEIVSLSLAYGVLTEYTAFLALEETDRNDQNQIMGNTVDNLVALGSVRSGAGAVSQSININEQKAQSQINSSNAFLDANMRTVAVSGVRQIQDLTFYYGNGVWVDSRIGYEPDDVIPDRGIAFLSDAYIELAKTLAQTNRQAVLTLDGDILLAMGEEIILVHQGLSQNE